MATLKALRIRIGSVKSSEKITGAMKMISSAKVHKNEQELKKLLPFRNQVKSIMTHLLATDVDFNSPLITEREVKRIGIVVFGSDDGLCGAYNINIFKHMLVEIARLREQHGRNVELTVIPVGKKIANAVKKLHEPNLTVEMVEGIDSKMSGPTVNEFGHKLREKFLDGSYDLIEVVYVKYLTRSRQTPVAEQLFPVSREAIEAETAGVAEANKFYIFEPDPNTIFNEVLPMFVLSTLQEITIENRASEQAARVMAMQSANDNAQKLLESLQIEFNKLRQEGITTELLDILGGQTEK
ncbi:MAG: ATP synthase F1 subunit gamma [Muribaculaceae bacterium]|nr:ATP synthase F1 subunit gamma [Muribaculaceae bacterium]MDE5976563.1 ATP synthase F1 subunit gamma [Muribaculaceae bacterium]MDE6298279.1 ATP synthase F1 subunit gamma [Muribaculaceae bacterium]